MTQSKLDQYKDEHTKEAEGIALLFGPNYLREYSEHTRRAAALLLAVWQAPTPDGAKEALEKAQWHIEQAQALREGPLKTVDKG